MYPILNNDRFFKEAFSREEAGEDFVLSDKRSVLDYLEAVLRYVASASDRVSEEDLVESAQRAFGQEGGEIVATLAEKWIEEGMEKGLRQGWMQGWPQGWMQGWDRGMLEDAREMVLEAIFSRFGMLPEDVVLEIEGIEHRVVLRILLRQAVLCEDLESFREVLKQR